MSTRKIESKDKRTMSASIPVSLYDEISKRSDQKERSMSWIVTQALEEWISREKEQEALDAKYYAMTLEGLEDVKAGRVLSSDEMQKRIDARIARRQQKS